MGTMVRTANANRVLIVISRTDAPIMMNKEEIIFTNAWETNILTESMSEVRFVRNFEGLDLSK